MVWFCLVKTLSKKLLISGKLLQYTADVFYNLSKVEFKLTLYSNDFVANEKIGLQIFHFDLAVCGYYIVWVSQ